jgi:hypothetical protein
MIVLIDPVFACPPGSGTWVLSNGKSECRKCPVSKEIPVEAARKLPQGCIAPFAGPLLDPDFYDDLKNARQFAQELDSWRKDLTPTLDRLQKTISDTALKLEEASEYNNKLIIDMTKLEAKEKHTSQMFWLSTITGTSVALILATLHIIQ